VKLTQIVVLFAFAATWLIGFPGYARAGQALRDASLQCDSLSRQDFSQLQDAPTRIVATRLVAATKEEPSYCQVEGYIWPHIGFELRLPISSWNGKFFEVGCGGGCGSTNWKFWCPMRRGYACIASDMGHRSDDSDSFLWAYNNLQAQLDLDSRAPHATALAGKAITERYYSKAANYAYFMGCSNGGTQALIEAQRFPWDFNGIIGIAGSPSKSDISVEILWWLRSLRDDAGQPLLSHHDLQLVHSEVLAQCDLDDGVKDGVVSDPYHCHVNLSELACRNDGKTKCLKEAQIEAVRRIYEGPLVASGDVRNYIRGEPPGTELGWLDNSQERWVQEVFRYWAFTPPPGARWSMGDFDFSRDYKRLGVAETLWDASNPDLRKFRDAGGKLLFAHGLSDADVAPGGEMDYYEMVERTMGGRQPTQKFARLFVIPGMQHCTGGAGAFAIDYVGYLEAWVEAGQAPDKLIGAHVDSSYLQSLARRELPQPRTGQESPTDDELTSAGAFLLMATFPLDSQVPVTFTRPIYPYPVWAKYKGQGDPTKAESFKAVTP